MIGWWILDPLLQLEEILQWSPIETICTWNRQQLIKTFDVSISCNDAPRVPIHQFSLFVFSTTNSYFELIHISIWLDLYPGFSFNQQYDGFIGFSVFFWEDNHHLDQYFQFFPKTCVSVSFLIVTGAWIIVSNGEGQVETNCRLTRCIIRLSTEFWPHMWHILYMAIKMVQCQAEIVWFIVSKAVRSPILWLLLVIWN